MLERASQVGLIVEARRTRFGGGVRLPADRGEGFSDPPGPRAPLHFKSMIRERAKNPMDSGVSVRALAERTCVAASLVSPSRQTTYYVPAFPLVSSSLADRCFKSVESCFSSMFFLEWIPNSRFQILKSTGTDHLNSGNRLVCSRQAALSRTAQSRHPSRFETTGDDFMPDCLRRICLCAMLLTGVIGGVMATGCGGGEEPLPSPDSEQYKEAKKRGDEVRAKEYGRTSVHDKKATAESAGTQGETLKPRPDHGSHVREIRRRIATPESRITAVRSASGGWR